MSFNKAIAATGCVLAAIGVSFVGRLDALAG